MLSREERSKYINAIKYHDPNGDVLEVTNDFNTFNYNGDIKKAFIMSAPVNDEELVRGLLVVLLHKKYGYHLNKIVLESRVDLGGSSGQSTSPRNDIIVKNESSEEPFLLFEVKRPDIYIPSLESSIMNQLIKPACNLTPLNNTKYLVYTTILPPEEDSDVPLKIVSIDFSKYKTLIADPDKLFNQWMIHDIKPYAFTDIPPNYDKPRIQNYIKSGKYDLETKLHPKDIDQKWEIINRLIWDGTVENNKKFEEFNKLLLAKIYDEKETCGGQMYEFQIKYLGGEKLTTHQAYLNINRLYKTAYRTYIRRDKIANEEIIGIDNTVLSDGVIYDIVEALQKISLSGNVLGNLDILAKFYEKVLREGFKQTKGLYLTHPNIVLLLIAGLEMEKLVEYTLANGNGTHITQRLPYIIDPSCGTGTFLIWVMKYITDYISKNRLQLDSLSGSAKKFLDQNSRDTDPNIWARDYLYGIEKESMLATASQINMIVHGDGSTHIYNADGLLPFKKYDGIDGIIGSRPIRESENKKIYSKLTLEVFDVVVSNPPFSASLEKSRTSELTQTFELKGDSETLFFERWYQLLKPKGRLGVVLPEAFFSVDDYKENRKFLFKHFNIKAVVSLPNLVFAPHTTTLTSLLFAQKKTLDEEIIFVGKWDKYNNEFNKIHSELNRYIRQISKTEENKDRNKFDINDKLRSLQSKCNQKLNRKVRFPVFPQSIIEDRDNWGKIRNKIKKSIEDVREWYVMEEVSNDLNISFPNIEVKDIGYKQGKKGFQEKSNYLFEAIEIIGGKSNKVLNIQNSTSDLTLIPNNEETVLGILRREIKWEL